MFFGLPSYDAGSVLAYFAVPGVSIAVPVIMVILIVYMLIKAQYFDAGACNPDGTLRRSTKIIIGSIIALLAAIGVLTYAGTFPSKIIVGTESVQIKGLYAVTIREMRSPDNPEESPPQILRKTNGFNAGGVLKGHFALKDLGRARLYVDANKPPFIYINTADGLVIVNQGTGKAQETLNPYRHPAVRRLNAVLPVPALLPALDTFGSVCGYFLLDYRLATPLAMIVIGLFFRQWIPKRSIMLSVINQRS